MWAGRGALPTVYRDDEGVLAVSNPSSGVPGTAQSLNLFADTMSDKNLVTGKVYQRLIALDETQQDPTSFQTSPASAVTQLLAGAHRPMEDVTMATVLQMVGMRDLKPHFDAARHGFVEQGDSDEEPEPRLAEGWYRAGRAATSGEQMQLCRHRGAGSGAWASCDQHMVEAAARTLGLEFQLAADILKTAVAPSWEEIGQLAAIAAIRTALNYFLGKEIAEEKRQIEEGDDSSGDRAGERRTGRTG